MKLGHVLITSNSGEARLCSYCTMYIFLFWKNWIRNRYAAAMCGVSPLANLIEHVEKACSERLNVWCFVFLKSLFSFRQSCRLEMFLFFPLKFQADVLRHNVWLNCTSPVSFCTFRGRHKLECSQKDSEMKRDVWDSGGFDQIRKAGFKKKQMLCLWFVVYCNLQHS